MGCGQSSCNTISITKLLNKSGETIKIVSLVVGGVRAPIVTLALDEHYNEKF